MSSANKEKEKNILVILYVRIKKIVRGILWVSWVASFVNSTHLFAAHGWLSLLFLPVLTSSHSQM